MTWMGVICGFNKTVYMPHNQSNNGFIARKVLGVHYLLKQQYQLANEIYANKPTTIQKLKDGIIKHIDGIEENLCQDVIQNFNKRIDVCYRSCGGHLTLLFLRHN